MGCNNVVLLLSAVAAAVARYVPRATQNKTPLSKRNFRLIICLLVQATTEAHKRGICKMMQASCAVLYVCSAINERVQLFQLRKSITCLFSYSEKRLVIQLLFDDCDASMAMRSSPNTNMPQQASAKQAKPNMPCCAMACFAGLFWSKTSHRNKQPNMPCFDVWHNKPENKPCFQNMPCFGQNMPCFGQNMPCCAKGQNTPRQHALLGKNMPCFF